MDDPESAQKIALRCFRGVFYKYQTESICVLLAVDSSAFTRTGARIRWAVEIADLIYGRLLGEVAND
jgi:hypothetical protein